MPLTFEGIRRIFLARDLTEGEAEEKRCERRREEPNSRRFIRSHRFGLARTTISIV